jgi:hypothetical protein
MDAGREEKLQEAFRNHEMQFCQHRLASLTGAFLEASADEVAGNESSRRKRRRLSQTGVSTAKVSAQKNVKVASLLCRRLLYAATAREDCRNDRQLARHAKRDALAARKLAQNVLKTMYVAAIAVLEPPTGRTKLTNAILQLAEDVRGRLLERCHASRKSRRCEDRTVIKCIAGPSLRVKGRSVCHKAQ